LRSAAAGSFFFQPLDLRLEPADLLIKLGLDRLAVVVVAAASVLEEGLDPVQELLLPLADLDRVDLKGRGQLGQGLGLLDSLQGDLRLETGGMSLLACVGHDAPQDATETFDQFNIPSGPVSWVHFIGHGGREPDRFLLPGRSFVFRDKIQMDEMIDRLSSHVEG
jgi:hypothetical protein